MRILQISGVTPSCCGDGRTATLATVRAICRAGHQITYAFPSQRLSADDLEYRSELLAACEGNLALLPLRAPLWSLEKPLRGLRTIILGSALLGPRVYYGMATETHRTIDRCRRLACLLRSFRRCVIRQLEQALAEGDYDVVQVDYPWMVSIAARLPTATPKLFVAHEIQSEIVQQAYPGDALLHEAIRHFETLQMRRYDAVAALSTENAKLLRDVLQIPRVYCSPLGIDCLRRRPPAERLDADGVVRFTFLGGHSHRPNVDAVEWLCRGILPQLRAALPQVRLHVIGSYPSAFAKAFAAPDVAFVGFMRDFDKLLSGSIFLCPVRLGSGIRIKIVDAVLGGAPVISTAVGVQGLGLAAGTHYLAADSPAEFAQQALRLVSDDCFRRALTEAAQAHMVATFSSEATSRKRIEVLEDVICARAAFSESVGRKAA